MKFSELRKGDKVWVRGFIDCDGDLMFGNDLTYIKSSLIYTIDKKDIKLDGYDMSQAKESLKPAVELFVAEWYEAHKKCLESELGKLFHRIRTREEPYDDFYFWFGNNDDALTTIINMRQFGYTVKEEKLYTVEIPDPNSPNVTKTLMRAINGVIIYFTTNSDWVEQEGFQLTESEIRKDFDWAWQWAEEVTK